MQVINYNLELTKGVAKKHTICKELKTLLSMKDRKKQLKEIEEKDTIEPKLHAYLSKLGLMKEVETFMCLQNINKCKV